MSSSSLYLTTPSQNVASNNYTTLYSGQGQISAAIGYGNANVANYLPVANVAILGTTITGSSFVGDGGKLSNINIGNIFKDP